MPFTDQKATLSVVVCRYRRCCELLAFSSFPDLLDKFLGLKGVGVEISSFFLTEGHVYSSEKQDIVLLKILKLKKQVYYFVKNVSLVQKTPRLVFIQILILGSGLKLQ